MIHKIDQPTGASSVQGAIKVLLDRDFVTSEEGYYQLSDKFFAQYLLS